jgi:hypothetical protein
MFDSPATYEKVTRDDVQKAAALVFQKNHRTVGVLTSPPEPPPPEAAAPAPAAEAKP